MRDSAARGDAHAQAQQNSEFHACVIEASGNRTVQRLWSMLEPFARTYLTATVAGVDLVWLADRHVPVLDALEAGDPNAAAEQMRTHAREAESLLLTRGEHLLRPPAAVA
jgi:DNA-binding GntR family transcriptional regulator